MSDGDTLTLRADALPEQRQERIAQILDEYLVAANGESPISPEELLAQHPQDAAYLSDYLSGLNLFQNAVEHSACGDSTVTQKPGQTIGDYRLIREIGRGGMGVVYEAEQLSLKRRVALKVLPCVAAENKKNLHRFQDESKAAASVEHPNIVPIHAIGEENGVHFYAMHLVEGVSLTEYLGGQTGGHEQRGTTTASFDRVAPRQDIHSAPGKRDQNTRELPTALLDSRSLRDHISLLADLGRQAAEALHAAHEYGVVHRDVKPSNLLVDRTGKLWITDFGLARCREGSGLTQTGDILGTLRYMSPELADGQGNLVDHRTDVFSLGITLYEAASHQHPYSGDEMAVLSPHRRRFKPLRHWDRRFPADFETIIMKAINESPTDRYASAEEMAVDLGRFLRDEPILARRPSLLNRAGKWVRRRRRVVGAAVAALMVVITVMLAAVSWEKAKTELYLSRSQENLQQTRKVLDDDFRLAEQLAAIPGAEGVRFQLLEKNLKYYREIVERSEDDPTLIAEVALAYSKIGELTAETGEIADALQYHQQAKQALSGLVANSPNNIQLNRRLAVSLNNIGIAYHNLGRDNDALLSCSEALAIQQRLLRLSPDSVELLADAATSYTNIGLVHKCQQALQAAVTAFSKAVALQEQVATADEEDSLRALALTYSNLASVHEVSNATIAKGYYGRATSIQKSLVKNQPLNFLYQRDLARTYNNLGYLAAQEKEWRPAELCYQDAIKIQQHLVTSAPAVAAYRRDLAVSQSNLGMVLTHTAQYEEAKEKFTKASRVQRQLLAMKPQDLQAHISLGGILNNVGLLLKKQNQLDQAFEAFRLAVEQQDQARQLAPGNRYVRELLSNHLFNYAQCCSQLGRTKDALTIVLRRRDLWHKSPERLMGVAQELLRIRAASQDADFISGIDQLLIDNAVETLAEAVDCGLPKDRLRDKSLMDLRSNQRFQDIVKNNASRSGMEGSIARSMN